MDCEVDRLSQTLLSRQTEWWNNINTDKRHNTSFTKALFHHSCLGQSLAHYYPLSVQCWAKACQTQLSLLSMLIFPSVQLVMDCTSTPLYYILGVSQMESEISTWHYIWINATATNQTWVTLSSMHLLAKQHSTNDFVWNVEFEIKDQLHKV